MGSYTYFGRALLRKLITQFEVAIFSSELKNKEVSIPNLFVLEGNLANLGSVLKKNCIDSVIFCGPWNDIEVSYYNDTPFIISLVEEVLKLGKRMTIFLSCVGIGPALKESELLDQNSLPMLVPSEGNWRDDYLRISNKLISMLSAGRKFTLVHVGFPYGALKGRGKGPLMEIIRKIALSDKKCFLNIGKNEVWSIGHILEMIDVAHLLVNYASSGRYVIGGVNITLGEFCKRVAALHPKKPELIFERRWRIPFLKESRGEWEKEKKEVFFLSWPINSVVVEANFGYSPSLEDKYLKDLIEFLRRN